MRFVLFYHSLVSDWNHGNAHFLRGIATELQARGHSVAVYEPRDSWSRQNLAAEHGTRPFKAFKRYYPALASTRYDPDTLDLDAALDDADVVIAHEWNDRAFIKRLGQHRARSSHYRLFFHDTHHRSATQPEAMARYDLSDYDGVLAYGSAIRDIYQREGWARRVWVWHEAADTRVFAPQTAEPQGDLVWIGNWGDRERTAELFQYLFWPALRLRLKTRVYGVRYPRYARWGLRLGGIDYAGWLPNYRVPEAFAAYKATVHVPRRPYVEQLPGIPTIRVFEALACGIPLVCAPWEDVDGLFTPGEDYLVARDGGEMTAHLRALMHDADLRAGLAAQGRRTILARHTCAHRVDELLTIVHGLGVRSAARPTIAGGLTPPGKVAAHA